jgi:glycosyltransferase involved in cell wall biosynthesis
MLSRNRVSRNNQAFQFPIRVVHLINDLDVGGAEVMLARLVEASNPEILENIVVSLKSGGIVADRIAARKIPVIGLDTHPGHPSPRGLIRAVRVLKQLRPAVLQTWLYHSDLIGLAAGTLARVPKIVWNVRCSALDPADHGPTLFLQLRTLAAASRWPSAIVCNSFSGRREHERLGYKPRRWAVISNGLDILECAPNRRARADVRRDLALAESVFLVGLVARLHPMKDHETFLKAAALIHAQAPDVHFIVAGRGVPESVALKTLVANLGVGTSLHILGEQNDVPRLLAALDIAVSSSSDSEGFPNVVLEAMACATPCVVTDTGDSALVVGNTGRVVPPKDTVALSRAVLELLRMNPEERRALGERARGRVTSEFSLAVISRQYQDLYTGLLGLNRVASSASTASDPTPSPLVLD